MKLKNDLAKFDAEMKKHKEDIARKTREFEAMQAQDRQRRQNGLFHFQIILVDFQ